MAVVRNLKFGRIDVLSASPASVGPGTEPGVSLKFWLAYPYEMYLEGHPGQILAAPSYMSTSEDGIKLLPILAAYPVWKLATSYTTF